MGFAAKLDEFGKPAWIALVVLAFLAWWPLGLATLAFAIGSGRMACSKFERAGRWVRSTVENEISGFSRRRHDRVATRSGNRAFDEYREETLRRLEEEEREFRDFLDRLRVAKDKAEFDQFMADRRRRSEGMGPVAQG
jgi:hypothetical protein